MVDYVARHLLCAVLYFCLSVILTFRLKGILIEGSCIIIYNVMPLLLFDLFGDNHQARQRRNHRMVEQGVHGVPMLPNCIMILID